MPSSSQQSVLAAPLQPQTVAQRGLGSPVLNSPREASLLLFCEPTPTRCFMLTDISGVEWRRLLHWLDISGLALYFLERLRQLDLCGIVPPSIVARLEQNQVDNTARMRGMVAESVRLQKAFQGEDISYAILKGLSLYPESVERLELRHQFDLDFLVAAKSAGAAKGIL